MVARAAFGASSLVMWDQGQGQNTSLSQFFGWSVGAGSRHRYSRFIGEDVGLSLEKRPIQRILAPRAISSVVTAIRVDQIAGEAIAHLLRDMCRITD